MILVISDDLTGAAEIAGLGLRYGLNVVLHLDEVSTLSDTDILIIATDTRSMDDTSAYNTMYNLKLKLKKIRYNWIYKKTDSVFRGHILTELRALSDANNKKRILLVASNPPMGRKIVNGKYYINDRPLNETEFAKDPDFSIRTSDVIQLLGKRQDINTYLLEADEPIDKDGIFIGEAGTVGDLRRFAAKVNDQILPAGGAGFFAALLEKEGYKIVKNNYQKLPGNNKKFLVVSGSSNPEGKVSPEEAREKGAVVTLMPKEIFYNKTSSQKAMKHWIDEVISLFENYTKVIIEISYPVIIDQSVARRLKEQVTTLVTSVLARVKVNELMIDGGATAYSIVSKLNYKKFFPVMEVAPGIIRMKVAEEPELCITLKPGSYKWPQIL